LIHFLNFNETKGFNGSIGNNQPQDAGMMSAMQFAEIVPDTHIHQYNFFQKFDANGIDGVIVD
jgi:hypothetical protein